MQKAKHSDVQISAGKASKYVVLHRKGAMELDGCDDAAISWIQLASFDAMIMVGCGENGMRRMAPWVGWPRSMWDPHQVLAQDLVTQQS